MATKKSWNITQSILKRKSIFALNNLYLIFCIFFLASCAVKPSSEKIAVEQLIPSSVVWERFLEKYPSTLSPFRMKISAKLSALLLTRRFSMLAWGNGKGSVRAEISASGISFLKIVETPQDSIFYLTASNKGYITHSSNYSELSSIIGLSMPFSIEDVLAIISENTSHVFPSYKVGVSHADFIEFILKDDSKLYLTYKGEMIKWISAKGDWEIATIHTFGRKQTGIIATFVPKKYTIEYILTSLTRDVEFSNKDLILRFPPKVQFFRLDPKVDNGVS